ncbi:MAG: OadG family protein [Lachnospiraceae bacterium]|nr:OadG family protein [Lachnospiraceae bacterium]
MTLLAASNIAEAVTNAVVGLGTVFVILAFLILIISLFKYVNQWDMNRQAKAQAKEEAKKPAAPAVAPAAAPAPAVAAPVGPGTMASAKVTISDEVEGPVAAAILAAVAETCGGNFKVTSIKKSK